jgi:hypothetical protein
MNKPDLWDKFYSSGKVDDYLNYSKKVGEKNEPDYDDRTDNQGAESWRG